MNSRHIFFVCLITFLKACFSLCFSFVCMGFLVYLFIFMPFTYQLQFPLPSLLPLLQLPSSTPQERYGLSSGESTRPDIFSWGRADPPNPRIKAEQGDPWQAGVIGVKCLVDSCFYKCTQSLNNWLMPSSSKDMDERMFTLPKESWNL